MRYSSGARALFAIFVLLKPPSNAHGLDATPRRVQGRTANELEPYSLPNKHTNASRAVAIANKRAAFQYGPGIDGGVSSPAGPLGQKYVATASNITNTESDAEGIITTSDNIGKYNGLANVRDYTLLYKDEWMASARPTGIDPGMLHNYTSDLLFSMSRLSFSPFAVRRLAPYETLPFNVDPSAVMSVTGQSLEEVHQSGKLFYADHRAQRQLNRTKLYAPACDAYFYIANASSEFLPLAIRSNGNISLVYTPMDSPDDWLLAKMMFEVNDFFFAQNDHLARSHWVSEVVYQAAIRTLSDSHPILGLLNRLMYGAFGIRPQAREILYDPGGTFDSFFGFGGATSITFARRLYADGSAGSYLDNYLHTNLRRRGLIDCNYGPALSSFPFYDDAHAIVEAIRTFTTSFVNAYYPDDGEVSEDSELQSWLVETNGPAGGVNFPTARDIVGRCSLVDLLVHFAYLVSANHHAINTNSLLSTAGVYPLHLQALYRPPPSVKGITNIVSYLPPLQQCLGFLNIESAFSRPLLANSNRSLLHMFDDGEFLNRTNNLTRAANAEFKAVMQLQSDKVKSRGFDENGLSQGMPFVWKTLDPAVAPWSLTI
ncbi:hypothetical protein M409DRAFT_68852 [Zasmidium cellare ATCC 36951]|uniref:Manganese lipoxygenase n=1 Tax=Zasmidium cellare ATCC 36951 TaxID=1080233 RepID=A0A6A6C7Q8_ZASCE|nr:uncharacterized protein M409DRAFT_68852 [Zasmidium cellare ATCC 36951]KAF2162883.1 hypothetical protein M409DRAFT_68852 [Zasmidium cellare ATCC 36951]